MSGIEDKRSPLLRALGDRVPVEVVTVERGRLMGLPLAILALSMDATQDATVLAHKHLTEEKKWSEENLFTEGGAAALNMEIATHILARALVVPPGKDVVNPDEVRRVASSPDELRRVLQPDEIQLLWGIYLDHIQKRSPLSRAATWEEVEETLESLGKGRVSTYALSGYDNATLRFMLHEMAVRMYGTPTSSPSSATSPSSGSPDASSASSGSPMRTTETSLPSGPTLIME